MICSAAWLSVFWSPFLRASWASANWASVRRGSSFTASRHSCSALERSPVVLEPDRADGTRQRLRRTLSVISCKTSIASLN